MPRRAALLLALTALTATLVGVPPAAAVVTCTAPCVDSVTVNGGALPSGYAVTAVANNFDTEHQVLWNVTGPNSGDPYELGAAARDDTWVIKIDTGTVVPRVAFTHGDNVTIDRTADGDGSYHVTITASPEQLTGVCNQSSWPWTCPPTATQQWDGYLDGQLTDYGSWEDTAQRDAMYGMDFATNVAATSSPPEITGDASTGVDQLLIRLAAPHFLMDGTTVFHGFVHLRIPNAFLRNAYGIDDPATLTTAGLDPELSGSGGTVTVTPESDGDALLVDATNLTFSARALRLHLGATQPRKPTGLRAKRKTAHKAKLHFHASVPRGSKVTGYQARCEARHSSAHVTAKGHRSPIKVTGLQSGVAYVCQVRAKSQAGKGPWSAKAKLKK
jgi:Fibronectin type III domain